MLFALAFTSCSDQVRTAGGAYPQDNTVVEVYDYNSQVFYMDYFTYNRIYSSYGYPGVVRYHRENPSYYRNYRPGNETIVNYKRVPNYRQPNYQPRYNRGSQSTVRPNNNYSKPQQTRQRSSSNQGGATRPSRGSGRN